MPRQPGRVRVALAKKLEKTLSEISGLTVTVDPLDLVPASGYWKQADVMRWEGRVRIVTKHERAFDHVGIGSWDSMTACLKGFVIVAGPVDGYHFIEVGADTP